MKNLIGLGFAWSATYPYLIHFMLPSLSLQHNSHLIIHSKVEGKETRERWVFFLQTFGIKDSLSLEKDFLKVVCVDHY